MSFNSLNLSEELLNAVKAKGYTEPSPIQAAAIPAVLEGRDVMAAAQTGTGKTAGFTLPLLDILSRGRKARSNQARALILTPTRELAAQVEESVTHYGANLPLKSAVVFGGVKINPQKQKLLGGVDILVATPGRLLDLYSQNCIKFQQLEVLVLDEADRMLDMGFIHDIRKILALLPKNRQNLMFSATFSEDIRDLAKGIVNDPIEIDVAPRNTTVETVEQLIHPVDKRQKTSMVTWMIQHYKWDQVLIFTKTKHGANKLTKSLVACQIEAAAIHGSKSQGARTKALANFKNGTVQVLVATDIAARGIDIDQLPQVINFDLPHVPEDYVHRIGRTGRAGAKGVAISLVSNDEFKQLNDIEQLIQQHLRREVVAGFEPVHKLQSSREIRPLKKKKPRKIKPEGPRIEHHDGQRSARTGSKSQPLRGSFGKKSNSYKGKKSSKPSGSTAQRSAGNGSSSQRSAGNTSSPQRSSSNTGSAASKKSSIQKPSTSGTQRFSKSGNSSTGGSSSPKRKSNSEAKFKGNRHSAR